MIASIGWAASVLWGGALSWDSLLASAKSDPQVVAAYGQVRELRRTDGTLLWDKVGAKWNLKRGDLKEMEWDVRVSPTAWGERGANRASWDARRALSGSQADQSLAQAVVDRLQAGLHWVAERRELAYHEALRDVYDERIAALSKLVGDPRFDARDLVASQLLRTENAADAVADRSDLESIEHRLSVLAPGHGPVDLDTHLVSIARVQQSVGSTSGDTGAVSPDLAVAGRKLDLAVGMEALERTRSSRWLDYLQLGWDWEDSSTVSKKNRSATEWRQVTAEVGIVLPFFDGSSQDRARRLAALADARGEYMQERRDLDRRLVNLRMDIRSLIKQRDVLDSLSAKVDAGAVFGAYALKSGGDPLLLLQAKSTTIESSWRSEKLRFDILDRFLTYLYLVGGIARVPSDNPLRER